MRFKTARIAGITGVAGVAAGLLALLAGSATPALAATTDTGGTFTLNVTHSNVTRLAKAGLVVLPTGTGTATSVNAGEHITLQVRGGDATFIGTAGTLHLAGGLLVTDGATGRSLSLTGLAFSYDTGRISMVAGGSRFALGSVGGSETGSTGATSQTFSVTGIYLSPGAARYLDRHLHTSYFKAQADLGGFTTTYTVETS